MQMYALLFRTSSKEDSRTVVSLIYAQSRCGRFVCVKLSDSVTDDVVCSSSFVAEGRAVYAI